MKTEKLSINDMLDLACKNKIDITITAIGDSHFENVLEIRLKKGDYTIAQRITRDVISLSLVDPLTIVFKDMLNALEKKIDGRT